MFVLQGFDQRRWGRLNDLIRERLESEGVDPFEEDTFDLLEYRHRLPVWLWARGREACARVFSELWAFARDEFEHVPSAMHRYVLYWSLIDWREETDARLDEELDEAHRARVEEDLDAIDQLLGHGVGDLDFIHVAARTNDLLRGEDRPELKNYPFADLLGVLPEDVRMRVRHALDRGPGDIT